MKKWMTKAAALVLAGSMLLQPAFVQADTQTQTQEEQTTETKQSDQKVIVIDAGHQTRAMSATEPNGPGSKTRKAKVTGGATGVATHLPEYKLNLIVAKKLKKELTSRGYKVIMVRTKNNVRLSNVDRAKIANKYKADAFIRIHANGSDSSSANGMMTICQTASNPYNGNIYSQSQALSTDILDQMVAATGAKRERVWETDTMSGINWCRVPVTIVEIGYMTNAAEDALLATDDYRSLIAVGIANGIDRYFRELSEN